MFPAIFFQCPFCSIQDLCKTYPAELKTIYWGVELTAMEHVDQMQDKAHGQGHVKHTQAGAEHARTNGPRKQVQGTRASRHWVWVDLRVCIAGQEHGKERATRKGTGTCSYRACSGSTRGKVPGQAYPRSPRPWLQIVTACAMFDRLRLLKVVRMARTDAPE